jgi:putative transposase
MPRSLRNLPPGSVVHCVNRGNDKRVLFDGAQEFEDFLRLVIWAKAQCAMRILAYCIMSNHWHFVLWSEYHGDVSRFLHRLTTTHAMGWRRRTDTVGFGHVYQHRFHDSKIFTEAHYYNVLRYVEQNPLRANLVRASRDWRWSSLQERLGNGRGIILEDGPALLPLDWPACVDEHLSETTLQEIRSALQRY